MRQQWTTNPLGFERVDPDISWVFLLGRRFAILGGKIRVGSFCVRESGIGYLLYWKCTANRSHLGTLSFSAQRTTSAIALHSDPFPVGIQLAFKFFFPILSP